MRYLIEIVSVGVLAFGATACGSAASDDAGSPADEAITTQSVKDKIATLAHTLTGERGPFTDKVYWLAGKDPASNACIVSISRDDSAYLNADISTEGSRADMGFGLSPSPVENPVVKASSSASLLKVAVNAHNVNGGIFSNNIEAHFSGTGYAGLQSVRIFTDNQVSGGGKSEHVESTCSGLSPVLALDVPSEGPALARAARSFYEANHSKKLASPVVLMGCGLGHTPDKLDCNFDSGNGNDAHDIPPDQLEVTFAVAGQRIGAPLSASLNGE
jgi:hypothetical protein